MAARFWVGGTGTWDASDTTHWASSSGGAGGQSVPGSGDTVTFDGNSGGGTVTVGYDPNVTSIVMGAFTGTLDMNTRNPTMQTFNGSGTGVRTLTMGSGTWTITGSNTTIFTLSTSTNLTFTASTATVLCTYSGGTGTRTFIVPAINFCKISVSAGTDIFYIQMTTGGTIGTIDFTGFTGTLQGGGGSGLDLVGDLTLGAGMTTAAIDLTHPYVFKGTGLQTITSNGVVLNHGITINGSSASVILADALDQGTSTITLTSGTFNAGGFSVTCRSFASSNTNTRTLTMGSGQWTITGNAATVWDITTFTNLTFNKGSLPVIFNYSGSTGTRTINSGAITPLQLSSAPDFNIIAGTDTVNTVSTRVGHLNFTGFSGTLASGTRVVYGDLTLSAGMTWTSGTALTTFGGTSGTQTITTNGVACNSPFTVDGVGGTVSLAGNFSMDGASARTLTLTNGTFNANGFNVTCGLLVNNNSNTRLFDMGTGTPTLTLTGTGTVFSTNNVAGIWSGANATILVTDVSALTKTLIIGTNVTPIGTITLAAGGTGAVIIQNGGTVTVTNLNVTGPKTVTFNATRTYTITNLNITGTAGNLVTLASSTPGSQYSLSVASGLVEARYVAIQDSIATGGAYFQAINSTDNGNNTGWNFATAAAPTSLSAGKKFARFGGARAINKVLDSKLHGYRKLGG